MKLSLPALREMKREGRPIVMITAYDHPSGRIVDRAGVDLVLVGDSAANVVLGHESTVPATMDEMTMLTAAVSRGVERALVIGDLPFMSYQVSDGEAVANAGRLIKQGGADVVKLEGAGPSLDASARWWRGHPRDGPPRADAAVGHRPGRLQGAGPPAEAARRLFATRSRWSGRAASRSCWRRCRLPSRHHQRAAGDPHHRHRLRAPASTARCWCCTICSVSTATGRSRASSSATPRSAN